MASRRTKCISTKVTDEDTPGRRALAQGQTRQRLGARGAARDGRRRARSITCSWPNSSRCGRSC